jgi:hypothetical protein
MRISGILFLISIAHLAQARRGSHVITVPPARPSEVLNQWGYPYGWGLSIPDGEDGMGLPEDIKKVKPVTKSK